jgi:hypothetical protein
MWCGTEDDRNHLTVIKIPTKSCDLDRKALKSAGCDNTQPSVKSVSLKETGNLTSCSEDETDSIAKIGRKLASRYDEKKQINVVKAGKSKKSRMQKEEYLEMSFIHKTKLRDEDISVLLDDEDFIDEVFIPNKVTDKSKCDQSFQRKSSHRRTAGESETAVVKKTSEVSAANVETKHMQGSSGTSSSVLSGRMSRGGNVLKSGSKVQVNSIKFTSEIDFKEESSHLTSTLACASKKKQHAEQLQRDVEDCTELKSLETSPLKNSVGLCASASVCTPGSTSVVSEGHSDVKNKLSKSQFCTSRPKDHHTCAKKKLSYEDSGSKRKLSTVESHKRCNVTDTSVTSKGERTEGAEWMRLRREDLSSPTIDCTSNDINDLEHIDKSHVIDYYLESMKNSDTSNRLQNLLHKDVSNLVKLIFYFSVVIVSCVVKRLRAD